VSDLGRDNQQLEGALPQRRGPRPILGLLVALIGLFLADALLFRTSYYRRIVEPYSSTGLVELIIHKERLRQANGGNLVLTMGDSRFAYAPRFSNALTPKTGYAFWDGGVAGSSPRILYYMLRDLDPDTRAYRAIVIGVDDYDDEDTGEEHSEDDRVLRYVAGRLRLSDAFELASSFRGWPQRWEAFLTTLFKGLIYQKDLQAFLVHPRERIEWAKLAWDHFDEWTYDYVETDRSMAGSSIDWTTMKATYPAWAENEKGIRAEFEGRTLRPVVPQNGHLAEYRRLWFGRIIDRYSHSPTRIVFLHLPWGPFVRPENLKAKTGSVIREFARANPKVLVCDEHAFDSLEHPEFFKDGLHLNREGIARFSPMMALEVSRVLGPPKD
jgi:hypothetical protein